MRIWDSVSQIRSRVQFLNDGIGVARKYEKRVSMTAKHEEACLVMNDRSRQTDFRHQSQEASFPSGFFPRQRAGLKSRLVDGEMVVLDQDGALVHQLNRTATYIWERCNGQHAPAEIAAELCQVFEVDPKTALKDVFDAIRQLQDLRLLQS